MILSFYSPYFLIGVIIILIYALYQQDQLINQSHRYSEAQFKVRYAQMEQKYLASKQNLIVSLQSFPEPILLLNEKGEIISYNDKMQQFSKKILQNKHYSTCFFPFELQYFIVENEKSHHQQKIAIKLNNQYYMIYKEPIIVNEKLTGNLIYLNNITALVKKDLFQQEFIQNASHELKTPISVLKGMLEIVLRPETDEQLKNQFLIDMEEEVIKLESLVHQLLSMTKEPYLVEKTSIVFEDLLTRAYNNSKIHQRNMQFVTEIKQPTINCDEEKMVVILTNLISNAFLYSQGDEVKVIYTGQNIIVEDNGIGIPEEEIYKVFNRFYRGKNIKLAGHGLGLSIVQTFVERQAFKIDVKNKEKGLQFIITL